MQSKLEKVFPSNHKTIFVLDHTPYFGIPSDNLIDFEFLKAKSGPNFTIPLAPICKSLWTCSVESAIEYCRIAWDLFPTGKLIRFIVSDSKANILNTWYQQTQSIVHLNNALSLIGLPPIFRQQAPPNVDLSIVHGLQAAVEALCELTDRQRDYLKSSSAQQMPLSNRSRVICITSARDNESMKGLVEIFKNVLIAQNDILTKQQSTGNGLKDLSVIHHCHLVMLNICPSSIEPPVMNRPLEHILPILSVEVHSVKAKNIASKLSYLILNHYDLASTTVTGIPMKEEQNAASSANYDVEIYHSSEAHAAILRGNLTDPSLVRNYRVGSEYETVTLKWCTPRGYSVSEMQNCIAMSRITAVDVNSRPSSCLINFLLNGRSVMLEMPRPQGGKIISHMLAAHGGEIFIHTLNIFRSPLEDPPSISEGPGGRVTDYRINEFAQFIQKNLLTPIKNLGVINLVDNFVEIGSQNKAIPIENAIKKIERQTKYWPMTISSSLVFNVKNAYPLPQIVAKESMTDEEMVQCKQVIYSLIGQEAKHEPLQLTNTGHRMKGQRREEQYKVLWSELETILLSNLHSENHRLVYNCLVDCHKTTPATISSPTSNIISPLNQNISQLVTAQTSNGILTINLDDDKNENDTVMLDQAIEILEKSDSLNKITTKSRPSVIRATTDSPMSPPGINPSIPTFSKNKTKDDTNYEDDDDNSNEISLYDLFIEKEQKKIDEMRKKRPEFIGRRNLEKEGCIYQLYKNVKFDQKPNEIS